MIQVVLNFESVVPGLYPGHAWALALCFWAVQATYWPTEFAPREGRTVKIRIKFSQKHVEELLVLWDSVKWSQQVTICHTLIWSPHQVNGLAYCKWTKNTRPRLILCVVLSCVVFGRFMPLT